MSKEKVKIVLRWFEAFSSQDFDDAIALVHRDVVFVPPGDQAPYTGAESLRGCPPPGTGWGAKGSPTPAARLPCSPVGSPVTGYPSTGWSAR